MIVVFSYRSDWEHRCGRSCQCRLGGNSSDFDMKCVESEDEAAEYIAGRIAKDPEAPYLHLVCGSWSQLKYLSNSSQNTKKGADSIVFPYVSEYDFEDWDDYQREDKEARELVGRVTEAVRARLTGGK